MMRTDLHSFRLLTSSMAMLCVGGALADIHAAEPERDDLQSRLLARYGDEGIDANGDGTLTSEEIQAFFQERQGAPGPGHGFGPHGEPGMMMMKIGILLHMMDGLDRQSVPAAFSAASFPEADADQDGAIGTDEWVAFATTVRKDMLSMAASRHPEFDQDEDGTLNDEEFHALKDDFLSRAREAIVAFNPDADSDGDGALSESELMAVHEGHLAKMRTFAIDHHPEADVDGDGQLSEDEMFVLSLTMARDHLRHGGPQAPAGTDKGQRFGDHKAREQ